MRVLVVGGSGLVGSLVVPFLAQSHELRIFDRRRPENTQVEYVQGDVTQYDQLLAAMSGIDAVLYMVMGSLDWASTVGVTSAYDGNVKGLHLTLRAANEAKIRHAVHTSTMSVYADPLLERYFPDENVPPDAIELYGFTKRLGEMVCQNATQLWGMSVNALRLCFPTAEEKWLSQTVLGMPTIATTGEDVARAILGALDYRDGFNTFMISGDYENKIMNMAKAKKLLNWEPLARPTRQA